MKPKRMHMVHNMVVNYGLYKKLDIVVRLPFDKEEGISVNKSTLQKPTRCTAYQMTRFHSDEYVNFLQTVTPDTLETLAMQHGGLEQGIARCKYVFLP